MLSQSVVAGTGTSRIALFTCLAAQPPSLHGSFRLLHLAGEPRRACFTLGSVSLRNPSRLVRGVCTRGECQKTWFPGAPKDRLSPSWQILSGEMENRQA